MLSKLLSKSSPNICSGPGAGRPSINDQHDCCHCHYCFQAPCLVLPHHWSFCSPTFLFRPLPWLLASSCNDWFGALGACTWAGSGFIITSSTHPRQAHPRGYYFLEEGMNEWGSLAHSQVTGRMEYRLKKRDRAPFMNNGTSGWGLWVGCSTDSHHVGVGPRQPGASSQLSFTTG